MTTTVINHYFDAFPRNMARVCFLCGVEARGDNRLIEGGPADQRIKMCFTCVGEMCKIVVKSYEEQPPAITAETIKNIVRGGQS